MKPKHFILSLLALLAGINVFAYDAEIDGIYYDFSGDEAIVTYLSNSSSGNAKAYSGTVIIPQTVTYNGLTYSVTIVGTYAFRGCKGLTSVTIGNSVLIISSNAFADCSSLTSIVVETGNTVYDSRNNCNAIIETATNTLIVGCMNTVIPESVTSIGNNAFLYCSGLTSVTIPNSVTSIGKQAFHECSGLTSVTIPNSVTSIGEQAFSGCSILTAVTIPSSVTSIDYATFANCSCLTSVVIPNSVTSIGTSAFSGCSGLTSVTIPNSVTSIGRSAFLDCSDLTSITIPNSVTSIGYYAFQGCSSLTSVTIPESVTSIGREVFRECSGLTSVTIPNSVTSIGDGAFQECSGLTSVIIPNSVTNISFCAFWYCSGLTSVTIGNSVTSIGNQAFEKCSSLTSVTIPNSVTSIGNKAFDGCKLRNVLVKCTTPPSLGSESFSKQTYYHSTLYVPTGCWDAYAYDNYWYNFINIRETATTEEEVSGQQAYTLMDASTFAYSVYDPVNDCIGTINSVSSIDENNPNHSWQMIEANGMHYLYNIGAKKFVRREGSRLALTSSAEPIDVADGADGIVLAEQKDRQWILVSNERMSVDQAIITGVEDVNVNLNVNNELYNLAGQRMTRMQRGLYIRKGHKVVVK